MDKFGPLGFKFALCNFTFIFGSLNKGRNVERILIMENDILLFDEILFLKVKAKSSEKECT